MLDLQRRVSQCSSCTFQLLCVYSTQSSNLALQGVCVVKPTFEKEPFRAARLVFAGAVPPAAPQRQFSVSVQDVLDGLEVLQKILRTP